LPVLQTSEMEFNARVYSVLCAVVIIVIAVVVTEKCIATPCTCTHYSCVVSCEDGECVRVVGSDSQKAVLTGCPGPTVEPDTDAETNEMPTSTAVTATTIRWPERDTYTTITEMKMQTTTRASRRSRRRRRRQSRFMLLLSARVGTTPHAETVDTESTWATRQPTPKVQMDFDEPSNTVISEAIVFVVMLLAVIVAFALHCMVVLMCPSKTKRCVHACYCYRKTMCRLYMDGDDDEDDDHHHSTSTKTLNVDKNWTKLLPQSAKRKPGTFRVDSIL